MKKMILALVLVAVLLFSSLLFMGCAAPPTGGASPSPAGGEGFNWGTGASPGTGGEEASPPVPPG